MNQKVLKTLEYNKIITQLTGYAASTSIMMASDGR